MSRPVTWIIPGFELDEDKRIFYTIAEGNLSCHARGQKAYVDSYVSCVLYQLPFFLETIGFGYICLPITLAIILISIFGKIKENYRWFILNQALWDLLVIYNFICEKPSLSAWFQRYSNKYVYGNWLESINQAPATCFYSIDYFAQTESYLVRAIKFIFIYSVQYALFAPLFLLTFSRFLSMYFHFKYEKFATNLKVILIIIYFNIVFVAIVNLDEIWEIVTTAINWNSRKKCFELCGGENICNSIEKEKCDLKYITQNSKMTLSMFAYFQLGLQPILLIFSDIFAILLLLKLFQQLKLRVETNSQNLVASLRISLVILFQCFTTTILFVITFFLEYIFIIQNRNYLIADRMKDEKYIFDTFPTWFRFLTLPETVQCLSVIRIFLDSIIILVVLSCYRNKLISFISFLFLCFFYPKIAFVKFKTRNQNLQQKKHSMAVFGGHTSAKISTTVPVHPPPMSKAISVQTIVMN